MENHQLMTIHQAINTLSTFVYRDYTKQHPPSSFQMAEILFSNWRHLTSLHCSLTAKEHFPTENGIGWSVAHSVPDGALPTELQISDLPALSVPPWSQEWVWKNTTPLEKKVKNVISDVAAQWDKTGIPHELSERWGSSMLSIWSPEFRS